MRFRLEPGHRRDTAFDLGCGRAVSRALVSVVGSFGLAAPGGHARGQRGDLGTLRDVVLHGARHAPDRRSGASGDEGSAWSDCTVFIPLPVA